MKKIFLSIIILISLQSFAQVDSGLLKTSVSITVKDAAYIFPYVSNNETFDDLFAAVLVRLKVTPAPGLNSTVVIDSIENGVWIQIMQSLRRDATAIDANVYSRLDAVLRAAGQTYLVGKLNILNATIITQYNDRINAIRQRLIKH